MRAILLGLMLAAPVAAFAQTGPQGVVDPNATNVGQSTAASAAADGTQADAAYVGTGSASVVAALKGVYAQVAAVLAKLNTTLAVTGTFWQATQPVSGSVAVTNTVPVTGAFFQTTQPVSGTLSTNADTAAIGLSLATTLNAATVVPTPARATFAWVYTGLTASGATLTPETSDDSGTTWSTINCVQAVTGAFVTAITADGQCRMNAAARTTMRLRVSTAGTGTVSVSWNASSETGLVALSAPIISRVLNTNIAYTQVTVGVTSTLLLSAAAASRSMLEATNISGRFAGTATDVWCQYGTAAVLGQGFPVFGGGGQYNRNIPAAIDLRAVNCIAGASTTINVGSVQQ